MGARNPTTPIRPMVRTHTFTASTESETEEDDVRADGGGEIGEVTSRSPHVTVRVED